MRRRDVGAELDHGMAHGNATLAEVSARTKVKLATVRAVRVPHRDENSGLRMLIPFLTRCNAFFDSRRWLLCLGSGNLVCQTDRRVLQQCSPRP